MLTCAPVTPAYGFPRTAEADSVSGNARAEPPRAGVEVHAGWAGFLDDATIEHFVLGAAVRWHATPRLTIGPEITYLHGPQSDRDLFVVGAVTWDLRESCRAGCVVPYLVAAGGLMVHRNRFLGETFSSSEGAVLGGVGVRVQLTPRFFLAPEARVGWEPHTRIAIAGGWRF